MQKIYLQDAAPTPAEAFQILLDHAIERIKSGIIQDLGTIQLLLISGPTFSQGNAEEQGQLLKSVMAFLNVTITTDSYKESIDRILQEKIAGMEIASRRECVTHILEMRDNDVNAFIRRWLKKEFKDLVAPYLLNDETMYQSIKHLRAVLDVAEPSAKKTMYILNPSISKAEVQPFLAAGDTKGLIKQLNLATTHSMFAPDDLAKLERTLKEHPELGKADYNKQVLSINYLLTCSLRITK